MSSALPDKHQNFLQEDLLKCQSSTLKRLYACK